jgi:hypothetical protein
MTNVAWDGVVDEQIQRAAAVFGRLIYTCPVTVGGGNPAFPYRLLEPADYPQRVEMVDRALLHPDANGGDFGPLDRHLEAGLVVPLSERPPDWRERLRAAWLKHFEQNAVRIGQG